MHRSAAGRGGADPVAVDSGGDGLGLGAVVTDRVPPSTFFASQRVEAVIGDDVKTVLALHDVGHASGVDQLGVNPKRQRSPRLALLVTSPTESTRLYRAPRTHGTPDIARSPSALACGSVSNLGAALTAPPPAPHPRRPT
jgi:hypothetical protein